ncbi:hypothetical protein I5E81_03255 [Pseudomonas aeruginosa]|nr:hypothetical protein [Pseudomonas aeruginosa]
MAAKGLAGTPLRDAPASVEQAGGDERAAFELFVRKHCGMPAHIAVNWDAKFTNDAWEGWKARAALAQPSPAQADEKPGDSILCYGCFAKGVGPDHFDEAGKCLAAQAEAERPEVVARVVHSNPVVLGQCGPLNANDELMTVAQHAASVARWAEMFNRVEQQRDAALARVAELERQEPVALANRGLHAFWVKWTEAAAGLYGPGIKLYAAPVAQAQHSVPAAWYYDAPSQAEAAIIDIRGMWGEDDCPTYEDVASALRRLLAAEPGTEVPQAWLDVQAERRRQITAEGWTPEHDDEHADGQMAQAAGCYALHAGGIGTDWPDGRQNGSALFWPWDKDSWKPTTPRRDLVKACALALAEIERLDRAGVSQSPQPGATTASS